MLKRLSNRLSESVSAKSLAVFRIGVGLVLAWEAERYLRRGWVARYWIEPDFNFQYTLFRWLEPLPGDGMLWLFYALFVAAILVTVGLFYRGAMAFFLLGFSYAFLLEESRYLNHTYLICLLSFVMLLVPASRTWSLDALLFPRRPTVPAWSVWLIRFQIAVPYFFGGVAKINPDWLRAEPMRGWLASKQDVPLLGRVVDEPWMAYLFSYGGLLLDLTVIPLLLWRCSRPFAFVALTFFHMTNDRLFNIGIFPWIMLLATAIFLEPDWPKRLWQDLHTSPRTTAPPVVLGAITTVGYALFLSGGISLVPVVIALSSGIVLGWVFVARPSESLEVVPHRTNVQLRPLVATLLAAWLLVQSAAPLRHFLLPGRSSWTEEGHRFTWHMMLRSKSGDLLYLVSDRASGEQLEVDPAEVVPDWQHQELVDSPHMILQFARYTAERFAAIGFPDIEVRAISRASLNFREPQLMIDPNVDLAAIMPSLRHADFIMPLVTPLASDSQAPQ